MRGNRDELLTTAENLLQSIELPDALKADFLLVLQLAMDSVERRSGQSLVDNILKISQISISHFNEPAEGLIALEELIKSLSLDEKKELISSYSLIFHLLNAAEKLHICRINREREINGTRRHTIRQAVGQLKDETIHSNTLDQIYNLQITPTITAHPTEARRLSVLYKLDEIAKNLSLYNSTELTQAEKKKYKNKIHRSILLLSATSSLRETKLDALQEVHLALHYLSRTIWEIVPEIYKDFVEALDEDITFDLFKSQLITFRSWIGGDRDGNPNVKCGVTEETLKLLREKVLNLYLHEVKRLQRDISISMKKAPVSNSLLQSIRQDAALLGFEEAPAYIVNEPYRIKFSQISLKLHRAITDPAFYSIDDFLLDLRLIEDSLVETGFLEITKDSSLFRLIARARTFGFHFAALDIRQHSLSHENAVAEILMKADVNLKYKDATQSEREKILTDLIYSDRKYVSKDAKYSQDTQELIDLFSLISKHKLVTPDAIQSYIISMTHDCSDMLEVLFMMKEADIDKLHIVPLFETIDDLERSKGLFEEFLSNHAYREHLKKMDDFQEIMLGYSDSNKDGGFLISNLLLNRSCLKLVYTAEKNNIKLGLFHGRGGTIARGGGRSVNAIRASSGSQSKGYIRFTEQGEVISFRYGLPALAHRHLEQIISAMLTESAKPAEKLAPEANQEIKRLGNISVNAYRDLIKHQSFWDWYIKTTPVEFISKLKIASRPVSRSTKEVNFEGLRAIPWGFAWNQSRFMVPSWYGVGTALEAADLNQLKSDYSNDSLFKIILDSLELELARSRPEIGVRYASASNDSITNFILDEHKRTLKSVLAIKGQKGLLENKSLIKNLIVLRNRHLDAVHITQRLLIEEFQSKTSEQDRATLESMILESINTIAAALQTTG